MPTTAEGLKRTVEALSAGGKGVLAADESTGTIGKRFDAIGVENEEGNRRSWRRLLFETEGCEKYVSGVILFEETLFQRTSVEEKDGGTKLVEILEKKGIVPGIKVDKGVVPLRKEAADGDKETDTSGLEGLSERCKKYYEVGARFAKWRAVLRIEEDEKADDGLKYPSADACVANATSLAKYAKICQENGLVPIVEPEILQDGKHSVETSKKATRKVLNRVFEALKSEGVLLNLCVLKPNMVAPGSDSGPESEFDDEKIAEYTNEVLLDCVPPEVPSILFLSGGQSEAAASRRLDLMHKRNRVAFPWTLSFSYGRALQKSALEAWRGDQNNRNLAQSKFLEQAKRCSDASLGRL